MAMVLSAPSRLACNDASMFKRSSPVAAMNRPVFDPLPHQDLLRPTLRRG